MMDIWLKLRKRDVHSNPAAKFSNWKSERGLRSWVYCLSDEAKSPTETTYWQRKGSAEPSYWIFTGLVSFRFMEHYPN